MTKKQMVRELSREYLAWTETPDQDYVPAVEEIQRLCEVIVRLREKLQHRRSDAEAERRGAMACVKWMERFLDSVTGLLMTATATELRAAIKRGEVLSVKAKKGKR